MTGSVHRYSIYHRPMLVQSPTELYPCPLEGFRHAKRNISIYRRPIAGMSLSEHFMTKKQKWRVCAGAGYSCVALCK